MSCPYPRYRDSGVQWLGEVPEHWELRPLKSVLAKNDGGVWGDDPDDHDFNGTIVLRSTEQTVDGGWSIGNPARRQLSRRETTSALLAAGDLVVTKSSGSEFHIGKASLVTEQVAQLNACFSNFMQRLRCLPVFEPRLAWYLLNSPVGRQQLVFHSNTTTGLANLNGTILGEVITPVPPLEEQRAIAAHLDRETERIDALVAKRRRLIERLQEYRTALITRTVTRGLPPEAARAAGLDPSPRLKPSGVEWLGDVPEHWEVARLKWSREGTINGVWGDEPDGENDIACVRVADFDRRTLRVNFDDPTLRGIGPSQRIGRELQPGDLLLEKSGGGEKQLVGCVVLFDHDEPAVSSNFIARISTALGGTPELWTYVHAALYSGKLNYPAIKQTTGIQNLDSRMYFDTQVGFPPPVEQEAIATYLDRETAAIDDLHEQVDIAIERLQEYRTALIAAAVTGKIDVRKVPSDRVAATAV